MTHLIWLLSMALSVTVLMGFDWTTEIKLFKDRIHTNHTFEHQLAEIFISVLNDVGSD